MTTIADELFNDFADSGDENEEEQSEAQFREDGATSLPAPEANGDGQHDGGMELEGDEEESDEADLDGGAPSHLKLEEAEDEQETKDRVEKMQLHNVGDVRSVAGLMKQLQPVIEVSPPKYPAYYI